MATHPHSDARLEMVHRQLRGRGIRDPGVLSVLESLPRHLFLPPEQRDEAYLDQAVVIGEGQTISQPYIVALMTECLELHGEERVLEIGTGSGFQTAVLAELAAEVYTIEILESLAVRAGRIFSYLGYRNVRRRVGDAFRGWPEAAPFERIIVTAAPPAVPPALLEQLADGGRMVIPVGDVAQQLQLILRKGDRLEVHDILPVHFVPMTGRAQNPGEPAPAAAPPGASRS